MPSRTTLTISEETHYRVLSALENKPKITQRELADELGVSLGKTNY
ncbi:MAG: winged helix-turn-helix transcriptional regulator, partial [Gammaproteobacteria bacterium]